uniref:Sema domain-containing protein n=1 Tax=Meloidogyne enterolobii TaxID=390850 RepID=A0A6V7VUW3_MELEN|nr:unnamed protein product [Meloidogyne enterolobii]
MFKHTKIFDVPCFSGQDLPNFNNNKCQYRNRQKQRQTLATKGNPQQNSRTVHSLELSANQRREPSFKLDRWSIKVENFQKKFPRNLSTSDRLTTKTIFILLFLLLLIISSVQINGEDQQRKQQDEAILAVFRDSYEGHEVELQRMVSFSEGLAIREHALTGPRADSVLCADALNICKEPLVPTDSHIKALAIYPDSNKLIECTSLYQGRCRTRNLSNIRRESDVRFSRPGIVPNDDHSSAQIFVGSGPSTGGSSSQPRVLYVGSTYVPISLGPRDALDVPSVSSISLENGRLFELTEQSISSGTYMKLDYRRMPFFRIDYIGGFEANGFAYFATRQPKYTPQPDAQPIISKLVRVCTQDPNFYSYTEAPLECEWAGQSYNLLQAIYLANAGFDLAATMRLKPTDLVLFGAFARGKAQRGT